VAGAIAELAKRAARLQTPLPFHPSAGCGYTLVLSIYLRPILCVFVKTLGVAERLAPFGVREFALHRRTAREYKRYH
jgi:hypothetical protein